MTITIAPTPEDIRDGAPRDCDACPIAHFLRRVMPEYEPSVGRYHIRLRKRNEQVLVMLEAAIPEVLRDWIDDYDEGKLCGPVSVEVEFR